MRSAAHVLLCILALALGLGGCFQPISLDPTADGGGVNGGGGDGGGTDGGDGGLPVTGPCTTDPLEPVRVPSPPGLDGFIDVRALEFDEAGNLWVLDREWNGSAWTGSLVVLSPAPAHALVRSFGRDELGLVQDFALAPSGGPAFVLSWDGNAFTAPFVRRYARAGGFETQFELPQSRAETLGVDAQGLLYSANPRLVRYSQEGVFEAVFGVEGTGSGQLGWPLDLQGAADGSLWVADLARNNVQQYDTTSGQQITEFGGRGPGNGFFDDGAADGVHWGPTRIARDAQGNVYANDPWSSRVQKFSADGLYRGQFDFGGPRNLGALAVEPSSGRLYVARKNAIDILCAF